MAAETRRPARICLKPRGVNPGFGGPVFARRANSSIDFARCSCRSTGGQPWNRNGYMHSPSTIGTVRSLARMAIRIIPDKRVEARLPRCMPCAASPGPGPADAGSSAATRMVRSGLSGIRRRLRQTTRNSIHPSQRHDLDGIAGIPCDRLGWQPPRDPGAAGQFLQVDQVFPGIDR